MSKFNGFNKEEIRDMAFEFYDFIVENCKFFINQERIEFNCDTIEYAALTHNGILLLDNFSVPVTVQDFSFVLEDYVNEENNCKRKRAELFILFKEYLENNWLCNN